MVKTFSEEVRSGKLRGATGKLLTNIVAVGIGGSYLGPEFVHEVGSCGSVIFVVVGSVDGGFEIWSCRGVVVGSPGVGRCFECLR